MSEVTTRACDHNGHTPDEHDHRAEMLASYIGNNRRELDEGFVLEVLSNLPTLIMALDNIFDSIDSRLGELEKRLHEAGIKDLTDTGITDGEEPFYFALYSLTTLVHYGRWNWARKDPSAPKDVLWGDR